VVAGILAERPAALAATGGALVAAAGLVRFFPPLRTVLAAFIFPGTARRRWPAARCWRWRCRSPSARCPYWTFVATHSPLLYVTIGQGLNLQIGTCGRPSTSPVRRLPRGLGGDSAGAPHALGRLARGSPSSCAVDRRVSVWRRTV